MGARQPRLHIARNHHDHRLSRHCRRRCDSLFIVVRLKNEKLRERAREGCKRDERGKKDTESLLAIVSRRHRYIDVAETMRSSSYLSRGENKWWHAAISRRNNNSRGDEIWRAGIWSEEWQPHTRFYNHSSLLWHIFLRVKEKIKKYCSFYWDASGKGVFFSASFVGGDDSRSESQVNCVKTRFLRSNVIGKSYRCSMEVHIGLS